MSDDPPLPKFKNDFEAEEKFDKTSLNRIPRQSLPIVSTTKLINETLSSLNSDLNEIFGYQDNICKESTDWQFSEHYPYSDANLNSNHNITIPPSISTTAYKSNLTPHSNPWPSIPLTSPQYQINVPKICQKTITEKDNHPDGQECSVCFEVGPVIEMPCNRGHRFCQDCLSELFKRATLDHSLLPVRCCGWEVDYNLAYAVLDSSSLVKFQKVWYEFTCSDKMYCPNPRCSKFIDLSLLFKEHSILNTHGSCSSCGTLLCYGCRTSWHNGMTCEQFQSLSEEAKVDINDVGLIKLADEKGWRRCLKCRRMVELRYGCHHITCNCGYEFCYICGEQWPARGARYKCKNGCRLWHNNRSSRSPGNSSQASSRSNSSGSSGSDYKVKSCNFWDDSNYHLYKDLQIMCKPSLGLYETSPSNSSRDSSPNIRHNERSRSPSPSSENSEK